MDTIPIEIIEYILCVKDLSFIDVCRFGSISSRYCNLVNSSNLTWRTKFKQIWPYLITQDIYQHRSVENWKDEFRQRLNIGRQTTSLIERMSAKHIRHEELSDSDFVVFEEILNNCNNDVAIYFMMDELMNCIHHKERNTNMTNKYYSEKVLRHLRQMQLSQRWEAFKNAPLVDQLLEHGAVIVAQWSQPTEDIREQDICSKLDDIAVKVLEAIKQNYGDKHQSLGVGNELRESWRSHNIDDNFYSPYISRQVIETISKVLFKDLGFYGNSELYYCHENSYINKVLENGRGIPITLSILYESVARRVGIKCEPVSFPGHFLLRWRDTYKENMHTQFFYIDVFNGGAFLGKDSCPQFANPGKCPMSDIFRFGPATPIQVVQRMANNLEMAGRQRTVINGRATRLHSALRLQNLVSPDNLNCLLQLARFCMQYNMDVSPLRQAIEKRTDFDMRDMGQVSYILRTLRDYDQNFSPQLRNHPEGVPVKKRIEGVNVEFAVGMIMRHLRYDYVCVIIGWDPECVASEEWKRQMGIIRLSRQSHQPFYHVLASDGSNRYAAEENLTPLDPQMDVESRRVTHCEIGRYFDTFCGLYYHMNEEMLRSHPDDISVLKKKLNLK